MSKIRQVSSWRKRRIRWGVMKRTLYRSQSLSRAKRMGSAASCDQVLGRGCCDKSELPLLCWKDLNVSTKLNTPEQVRYAARHYEICWGEKKSSIYRPATQLGLIKHQFLHRALFQPFSFYWKWVVQEQKLWLIMSCCFFFFLFHFEGTRQATRLSD